MEHRFLQTLPEGLQPACPPAGMGGYAYEYTTVVYQPDLDDPRAGSRYTGHHAQILEERNTLARVAVFPRSRSQDPAAQPATVWIDLASCEQHDASPSGLTTIGVGDAPKTGALFLRSGQL